jgi:hypothetical protein
MVNIVHWGFFACSCTRSWRVLISVSIALQGMSDQILAH